MENQVENNDLNQTIINNQVTESVIPKDTPYIPYSNLFDGQEADILMSRMDIAQFQHLDALKPLIDISGIRANGNAAVSRPTLSSNTFDPVLQQNPSTNKHTELERVLHEAYVKSQSNVASGAGVASPDFFSQFDYVITKITLNTLGGISVSTTYDKPFLYVGYGRAHKTNIITGAREEMSYLDKIPFYILSTIYNIHCVLIMMILFFGINYLYKKIEFQIN